MHNIYQQGETSGELFGTDQIGNEHEHTSEELSLSGLCCPASYLLFRVVGRLIPYDGCGVLPSPTVWLFWLALG